MGQNIISAGTAALGHNPRGERLSHGTISNEQTHFSYSTSTHAIYRPD